MEVKCISVSAFDSPVELWNILLQGYKIDFREYNGTKIPPDIFHLNDLDLVTYWDAYPRSMAGLHSALISNAQRLIKWKFMALFGRSKNDSPLLYSYRGLVNTYEAELTTILKNYFSVHRIIEANNCYSRFLIDEQTLLSIFQFGEIFGWEIRYRQRITSLSMPLVETPPVKIENYQDILEQGVGYKIERKHSSFSGTRKTVVTLADNHQIFPTKIADWLSRGFRLNYGGKSLFEPEDDGSVWGTDRNGHDFYAGHITDISKAGL